MGTILCALVGCIYGLPNKYREIALKFSCEKKFAVHKNVHLHKIYVLKITYFC